jgi:hypothetical protein
LYKVEFIRRALPLPGWCRSFQNILTTRDLRV